MGAPPTVAVEPSPIDAARAAYEHTRRALFPFRFERWVVLGLVAFLEQCGRGGVGGAVPGGPPFGGPGGGGGSDGASRGMADVAAWIGAHVGVIVAVAVGGLVLVLGVTALVLWIGSRATFVYIDDVSTGRAEIAAPWRAHAEQASSYFACRFILAALILAAVAVLVGSGALAVLAVGRGGPGGIAAVIVFIVLLPVFFLVLLGSGLAALALRDFVAPLQMHGRIACVPAARLLATLVRAHPVPFLLYVLLKVAFGIGQGLVLMIAGCLTCCLILIPVVTQTLLQPLFFFERAWSLHFLRQMGYDILSPTLFS